MRNRLPADLLALTVVAGGLVNMVSANARAAGDYSAGAGQFQRYCPRVLPNVVVAACRAIPQPLADVPDGSQVDVVLDLVLDDGADPRTTQGRRAKTPCYPGVSAGP